MQEIKINIYLSILNKLYNIINQIKNKFIIINIIHLNYNNLILQM